MTRPHVSRVALSTVVLALVVSATPARVGAQTAGTNGQDGSGGVLTIPSPGGGGGPTVTANMPIIESGTELPGQGDIPQNERLRTSVKITFSATVRGSGGGPGVNGGRGCTPSEVTILSPLELPMVLPHMDPPAVFDGGQGGVVTIPTWFWATYSSNPNPSSSSPPQPYVTCTSSKDALGRTVWSPQSRTATIRVHAEPTGYAWDFGDSDVSVSCPQPVSSPTNTLGNVEQPTLQHTYCVSSIRSPHDRGYPVYTRADFLSHSSVTADTFDGEIQTYPLSSINIGRYPVREVQAVLDE